MRRFTLIPILLAGSLFVGCAQVAQVAGEAVGIPVDEICTTFDGAYTQYETLLAQGDATEEQLAAARDTFVGELEQLADTVDGQLGDVIRDNAQRLAESADLQAPATIEAVEQIRDTVGAFCD